MCALPPSGGSTSWRQQASPRHPHPHTHTRRTHTPAHTLQPPPLFPPYQAFPTCMPPAHSRFSLAQRKAQTRAGASHLELSPILLQLRSLGRQLTLLHALLTQGKQRHTSSERRAMLKRSGGGSRAGQDITARFWGWWMTSTDSRLRGSGWGEGRSPSPGLPAAPPAPPSSLPATPPTPSAPLGLDH